MAHFLWFLFNLVVLLSFIYLFIGYLTVGKKIFPKKHKRAAVLFLGLGVLLTLNSFTKKESENTISFSNAEHLMHSDSFKTYTFQESPMFAIQLNLQFGKLGEENVPFEATSYLTGWVNGFDWEMNRITQLPITLNTTPKFEVAGVLKWNLFGITVYREQVSFSKEVDA